MAKKIQLIHHHEYLQRLFSCGPEVTSISVKNLQAIVAVGQNPWGSAHSQDPFLQPVLFSAKVSLVVPFASAAATDQLNQSTVNYSTLSKEILKCVRGPGCPSAVLGLLDHIFEHLLKWNDVRGETMVLSLDETAPLLRVQDVRELELKIELPKGTLLSESISITYSTFFTHGQLDAMEQAEVDGLSELNAAMGDQHQQKQILFPFGYRALVLTLDGLRVPTIIGINKNERTAKQNVIASISIEPLGDMGPDRYNVLEQVVYKTIEESSFETLETLAEHVVTQVADLSFPIGKSLIRKLDEVEVLEQAIGDEYPSPTIRIRLEKPTAVTFADAPCIEIVRKLSWDGGPRHPPITFPIQGTLQEWIKANPKTMGSNA